MSQKVTQTKLTSGNKKLSGDKVQTGPCQFPFRYKGELYNECYKGKYGEWCATKVDSKTRKMLKYAFCDKGETKAAVKSKKKANKLNSKQSAKKAKKPASPKSKRQASPPKAKKPVSPPKAKKTIVKRQFKVRDPLQGIENKYLVKSDDRITPRLWELPNRKTFPNWMFTNYKPYLAVKNSMKSGDKTEKFMLFKHQKLVRDYLQSSSPYRGLSYHGLGVGKRVLQ